MRISRKTLLELLREPPKRSKSRKRKRKPKKRRLSIGWGRRKKRKKRFVYCANRGVHPGGYRIYGKPYYWGGKPLCRNCYYFFTASKVKKLD